MLSARTVLFAATVVMLILPERAISAGNDLERVLHQLDVAADGFHTASADFEFDSTMTDPVPDTDVQKGIIYYERKGTRGTDFQMAAHIREINEKPATRMYSYSDGHLRLFEPAINKVTTITKASDYSSYILLGFGARGRELADKWEIAYKGPETIDGVRTEMLELVAKDPAVRKNVPRVTIWVDPKRGVSLRQLWDEGPGQSRNCKYFNIRLNESLPHEAFTFKTNRQTVYDNR
jgi:outer membrane lipoprotein-sorting protein